MLWTDYQEYEPYGVMTGDEAEELTNLWLRNARDLIQYSTRVNITMKELEEEVSDYAWIYEAGEDEDGNDLYNMDILRQMLDSIIDNTIKEIKKERCQKGV